VSKPIDYDAPRRPPAEIDDDRLDVLEVRGTSAHAAAVDLDEAEAAERFELPGADLSAEELTVPVVPMQADELRCTRCFLVQHRSSFTGRVDGTAVCRDCS